MITSRWFALLAALFLAGCSNTVLVPVAGGGRAEVTFSSSGPAKARKEGVKIERAGIEVNVAAKAINYVFDFSVSDDHAPRSVTVQDISDDDPVLIAEDSHPYLEKGHWHFVSPSKGQGDADLAWLFTIEASMRIYRFTLIRADGEKLVLDQASPYSQPLKAGIRKAIGMDY